MSRHVRKLVLVDEARANAAVARRAPLPVGAGRREYHDCMEEKAGPSFGSRVIIAALVLAVAAYILLKVIIGFAAAIAGPSSSSPRSSR